MKKFLKHFFIIFILISIYFYICAYSYAINVSNDLSNSVFRLHIIANSDSNEDQNLKYLVRDKLLDYMNSLCMNCISKKDVIKIATEHQNDFKTIVDETIKSQGFSYSSNINIGNFEFPTKSYGDIIFPNGYYDALKVEIGNSAGQNWWCVMFPPLCYINTSTGIIPTESKEILRQNLSEEEYNIISDSTSNSIFLKFKLLEYFKNVTN